MAKVTKGKEKKPKCMNWVMREPCGDGKEPCEVTFMFEASNANKADKLLEGMGDLIEKSKWKKNYYLGAVESLRIVSIRSNKEMKAWIAFRELQLEMPSLERFKTIYDFVVWCKENSSRLGKVDFNGRRSHK